MPRVPMAWLADHVELPADLTVEQLATDLVRVGIEDEAIHGAAVTGPLVVGRVLELVEEPQNNGKVIRWCQVDVGPHNTEDGSPRGIVCGAHNFAVGDLVVVALPGCVLPGPFAITARKTYGHVSDGMICSVRELGIGDDHAGILVLSTMGLEAEPGADAKELLGLGEAVLEVNVTPDRGYCFSMRGLAREYALSTGATFTDRGLPRSEADSRPAGGGFPVELDDAAPIGGRPGCDRFVAQVVRGVDASAASPAWLRRRLEQAGMRAISLAVDITNYVMLDLGQPLHAYDLASLTGPIVVRRARAGEKLVTLDDVERTLDPEDLLITDGVGGRGERILGLAGVMGGAETEVSASTTDVLLEGAHFDPISVARTSRRHQLPSEAAKRFERGVDPRLQRVAVQRAAEMLVELGGGTIEDAVTDVDETSPAAPIRFELDHPARLVGVPYSREQVVETLEALGAVVGPETNGVVEVTPPSWRPDLVVGVDLVEEVARLRGYEQIDSVVPRAPAGRGLTLAQKARRRIAQSLAEDGFVEVLSYPFVSPSAHDALGLPEDDSRRRAVRLANPLADTHPELRTNLLVTLLETARRNVGRGQQDLALFETGLVTRPEEGAPAAPRLPLGQLPSAQELAALHAAVPAQPRHLAGVLTGLREAAGWAGPGRAADHTDAIGAVLRVANAVGVEVEVSAEELAPWHPGRCARISLADGTLVGHAGELHPRVLPALELPARTCAFEIDLDVLLGAVPSEAFQAEPVSAYPLAKEDFAFIVEQSVPASSVRRVVAEAAGELAEDVREFDVFTGPQVGVGKKSIALAVRLRAADRTLTAEEVAGVRERIVAAAAEQLGAVLR